jgi:hypothetical protein
VPPAAVSRACKYSCNASKNLLTDGYRYCSTGQAHVCGACCGWETKLTNNNTAVYKCKGSTPYSGRASGSGCVATPQGCTPVATCTQAADGTCRAYRLCSACKGVQLNWFCSRPDFQLSKCDRQITSSSTCLKRTLMNSPLHLYYHSLSSSIHNFVLPLSHPSRSVYHSNNVFFVF